ncbi:MAG: cbb3-type cytochrome oxidase assembly protein CcoS [Aureliella sp.]
MSVIYVALPLAILLGGAALVACVRCICSGQYDDLETPAVRMLIDDKRNDDEAKAFSGPDSRPLPQAGGRSRCN